MNGGRSYVGYVAMAGGVLGLLLAPIMVTIKYMTGWAVIPEPIWVGTARRALGGLLEFATPPGLWMAYGSAYSVALSLMLIGFAGLSGPMKDAQGRLRTKGYWVVLAGLCLVIPGDAIHTWTWHRKFLAPWLAWSFVLILPPAVVASVTVLPTTPSGALWLFSAMMVACGYFLATGRCDRLVVAEVHGGRGGIPAEARFGGKGPRPS